MERAQKKTSKDDQNTCSGDQNTEFLNEEYLKARQRRKCDANFVLLLQNLNFLFPSFSSSEQVHLIVIKLNPRSICKNKA